MKKLIGILLLVLFAAMLLTACGEKDTSGGDDADTMTVTISGPSGGTATYTEGPYNAQGYLDPNLSAYVMTGAYNISLCSGKSGAECATLINIVVNGTTPQSYPTGTGTISTQISYNKTYSSVYSSEIGTVTLTSVGNVGEKVKGSFDAVVSDHTNTLGISGTFSVERDRDL